MTVEGQNDSFSAASKGYKQSQTMNLVMSYLAKQSVIGKKKKKNWICFRNFICSPCSVLRFALHVIRDNVEKVTLDVGGSTESIERANTKSNAVYKKGSYNSTSLQDKTSPSDDFELGEDDMEPTSSLTFSK